MEADHSLLDLHPFILFRLAQLVDRALAVVMELSVVARFAVVMLLIVRAGGDPAVVERLALIIARAEGEVFSIRKGECAHHCKLVLVCS